MKPAHLDVTRLGQRLFLAAWSRSADLLERFERSQLPGAADFRIAFVKQSTYLDLFQDPSAATPRDVMLSSRHRSGPIGLFVDIPTDFFIVHTEDDSECTIWQSKRQRELYSRELWDRLRAPQIQAATAAGDVDWSRYDLVIALENAVPARITAQYPRTFWATMVEHHRMDAFYQYSRRAPHGYDIFLNQRFGPTPASMGRRVHVVEWPYAFSRGDSLERLMPAQKRFSRIVLEANQDPALAARVESDVAVEVLTSGKHSLREHLERLLSSTIFYAPASRRPLWGNAAIEAVAAGCVVVGNRADLWNPSVIPRDFHCGSHKSGLRIIEALTQDTEFLKKARERQRKHVDWMCFWRPLLQLRQAVVATQRPLSLREWSRQHGALSDSIGHAP